MLFRRKKFIFNIHLVLTFLACLPLLVITLFGSLSSYRVQLGELVSSKISRLENTSQTPLKMSEILLKTKEQIGEFSLESVEISSDQNVAYKLNLTQNKERKSYFINQYTATIISTDKGAELSHTILMLHRNLGLFLLKNETAFAIGKNIVALSSIALFVLVVTGIFLYAPMLKRRPKKALTPNFKNRGFAFLYQLHGSIGVWLGALLCLMSFTGLYWSYEFMRNGVNAAFGITQPAQKRIMQSIKLTQARITTIDTLLAQNLDVQKIVLTKDGFTLTAQNVVKNFDENATLLPSVKAPVKSEKFATARDVSRFWLDLHQGTIFGEVGKAIWCVACVLTWLFIITGLMMTWRRINHKVTR